MIIGLLPFLVIVIVIVIVVITAIRKGKSGHSLEGKSPDQQKVIKYFENTGCIAALTGMKDNVYDQMVRDKVNSLNTKQKALERIGLDEDQLKEIPPVHFNGFHYGDGALIKVGKDGLPRSSKYDVAWFFFSNTQVYMYSYVLDMTSDSKNELAEEYFYKDVVSFSTYSESTETNKPGGCLGGKVKVTTDSNGFAMSVTSGEKFKVSTTGVPDADRSVSAMKQKLREKKG